MLRFPTEKKLYNMGPGEKRLGEAGVNYC